ncbi:MAG: S1C family serine protease [Acidimicrobiales bacterium]
MEAEENRDDEGPLFAWLPPEDRLWRHPSEVGAGPARAVASIRNASMSRTWTAALVAGVLGAVLASGVGLATGMFLGHTVVVSVPTPTPNTADVTESTSYASGGWPAIANDLEPSLVGIAAGGAIASGIVFTAAAGSSYLITAADAVSGGRITAIFDDGSRERAYLVGADVATGIAVLRVAGTYMPPVFGSASDLQVADNVLMVGASSAGGSYANGAMSSLDSVLNTAGGYTLHGMMAVSDATVPASANGGAVVDQGGAVVGVDTDLTSVDSTMQGMAFAIPIDTAEQVANNLIEGRAPAHPWIGIEGATDLPTMTASQLGVMGGAEVGAVAPGSPAARAGLQPGDIVTAFAGRRVTSSGVLVSLLAGCRPAQRRTISYLAGGHTHRTTLTVGALPGS